MAIDYISTIHTSVKHMDIDKMSAFLVDELNACPYKKDEHKLCPIIGDCKSCIKSYLSKQRQ